MYSLKFAVVLIATLAVSTAALAQAPAASTAASAAAPAPATKLNGASTFRDLLANPKSKALLYGEIPLIMDVFDMGLFADSVTLDQVAADEQAQTGGGFTAEVYAKLLKELAAL
jgi:hypothetical protein